MTGNFSSQNIGLSSWITLYITGQLTIQIWKLKIIKIILHIEVFL